MGLNKKNVTTEFESSGTSMKKVKYEKDNTGSDSKEIKPEYPQVNEKVKIQIDNLLAFMGKINWDIDGIEIQKDNDRISSEFLPLYESIALIKQDFDSTLKERNLAENKFRQREKRYKAILENITAGYYEVDINGNLVFFNDALCSIYGYTSEELMGMNYSQYTDEKNSKKIYQFFNDLYNGGTTDQAFDWEFIQKDGRRIYVETSASLIKNNTDRIIGFRGLIRNITERIQSEKKRDEISKKLELANIDLEQAVALSHKMIAESANAYLELDQIFQASTEGMWVISSSFDILRINKMLLNMIGKSSKEVLGKKCYEVLPVHLCHTKECPLFRIIHDNVSNVELDLEIKAKDNISTPYILSAYPFRDVENNIIGAVIDLKDIAERKNVETMKAEKVKAEAENSSKSKFLANMSHEIRTPLNGIIGMTELIKETELDDQQRNIFDTLISEASVLLTIINDVLDFSKIEAGKFEIENIAFVLEYLIEDVSNSIAVRARQKGLKFNSFIAPDIPSQVLGDPGRLRQVLMNLAGNALKFTPNGEISINVEMLENLEDTIKIRFSVLDTGIGLAKNKQEKIFESFTQADGSTTRKFGGTGLGTAISKQLVKLMGGEIGVESEEGKGSNFWFIIEFFKQPVIHVAPDSEADECKSLKVLVAGENQIKRPNYPEHLRAMGCTTVEAKDSKMALSIYQESISLQSPFELLFIADLLPDTTGFDLAGQIRAIKTPKKIPIMLIAGVGAEGDKKRCEELKIDGYLTRPFQSDEIWEAIKLIINLPLEKGDFASSTLVTKNTIIEAQKNKKKILVVEDYPTNQHVALAHLNGAGYQVDLAENGYEAINMYKQKYFDVIFMDIQMPIMGGFEATRVIRSLEAEFVGVNNAKIPLDKERVPIIAMTAHATGDYKKLCLEAGMDDYISKPLLRKDLLAVVNKWTESNMKHNRPDIDFSDNGSFSETKMEAENRDDDFKILGPGPDERNGPMNYDKALEEFMGKKEILEKVVNVFLENARDQILILRQAIIDSDYEAIKKEAHAIKGGAANLTAQELSEIALELENIGKSGELPGATDAMDRFEKEFARLESYLETR